MISINIFFINIKINLESKINDNINYLVSGWSDLLIKFDGIKNNFNIYFLNFFFNIRKNFCKE